MFKLYNFSLIYTLYHTMSDCHNTLNHHLDHLGCLLLCLRRKDFAVYLQTIHKAQLDT